MKILLDLIIKNDFSEIIFVNTKKICTINQSTESVMKIQPLNCITMEM